MSTTTWKLYFKQAFIFTFLLLTFQVSTSAQDVCPLECANRNFYTDSPSFDVSVQDLVTETCADNLYSFDADDIIETTTFSEILYNQPLSFTIFDHVLEVNCTGIITVYNQSNCSVLPECPDVIIAQYTPQLLLSDFFPDPCPLFSFDPDQINQVLELTEPNVYTYTIYSLGTTETCTGTIDYQCELECLSDTLRVSNLTHPNMGLSVNELVLNHCGPISFSETDPEINFISINAADTVATVIYDHLLGESCEVVYISECEFVCGDTIQITLAPTDTIVIPAAAAGGSPCPATYLDGTNSHTYSETGIYNETIVNTTNGNTCDVVINIQLPPCAEIDCQSNLTFEIGSTINIQDVILSPCENLFYLATIENVDGTIYTQLTFPLVLDPTIILESSNSTLTISNPWGNTCTTTITITEDQCQPTCPETLELTFPINGDSLYLSFEDVTGITCPTGETSLIYFDWMLGEAHTGNPLAIPPDILNGTTVGLLFNGTTECFTSIINTSLASIQGNIYLDENQDCVQDIDETINVPNAIIELSNGVRTLYGVSNDDGSFQIFAPAGNYALNITPPDSIFTVCPIIGSITVEQQEVLDLNVGINSDYDCARPWVDVARVFWRRCFSNIASVNYCNNGTVPMSDAYIELEFEEGLEIESSSLPYSSIGDNLVRFDLGDLDPFDCGHFGVTFFADCDLPFESTRCLTANLLPLDECDPSANWSGANIVVDGECEGENVKFNIANDGTGAMQMGSDYIIIVDDIMLSPGEINLPPMTNEELSFPADGSTYRIEVEQELSHPFNSRVIAVVEGCDGNGSGQISTGFVNAFPLNEEGNATAMECPIVIGSYDPNDKSVTPTGLNSGHQIEGDENLDYTIRFENTGNDTAFTVLIIDTLDSQLDVTTFQKLSASHAVMTDILDQNTLRFTFNNILLPDTATNAEAANGFIKYRINPKEGLERGNIIRNKAGIYFDFNDPIITNTVFHTIGLDLNVAINEISKAKSIVGQPNPTNDLISWDLNQLNGQNYTVKVYTADGRLMEEWNSTNSLLTLDAKQYEQGLYLMTLITDNGQSFLSKFIKQ